MVRNCYIASLAAKWSRIRDVIRFLQIKRFLKILTFCRSCGFSILLLTQHSLKKLFPKKCRNLWVHKFIVHKPLFPFLFHYPMNNLPLRRWETICLELCIQVASTDLLLCVILHSYPRGSQQPTRAGQDRAGLLGLKQSQNIWVYQTLSRSKLSHQVCTRTWM